MSFLKGRRGYEAFDEKAEEIEERQSKYINRFWLPSEVEATIIFMDDLPPVIDEHQIFNNGHWRNWFTCLTMVDEQCPICASGENASLVAYYTILDRSQWKDKQGKVYKDQIKLYGAKSSTMKILRRASNKLKASGFPEGLKYAEFEVYRTANDAVNVGDDITFTGKVYTEEEIKAINKDAEVVDYENVLAPRDPEELNKILGSTAEAEYDNAKGKGTNESYEHKPIKF